MAQPSPPNSGEPSPYGKRRLPYTPWPPGTYAAGPVQYRTAGPPARRTNTLAVTSMICGIAAPTLMIAEFFGDSVLALAEPAAVWLGWVLFAAAGIVILVGVVAVFTGGVGLTQIRRSGGTEGGTGMAATGVAIGIIFLTLVVVFVLLGLAMGGA